MDGMFVIDVISRIVHVGTAITLVGGSVFALLVLQPAAGELDSEAHGRLGQGVVRRWKPVVHLGILLFLVSGLYNYFRAMDAHRGDGLYHALVGTKILLALAVFFLASALVGRSPAFERFRVARRRWTGVIVLIAAIIVAMSGFLKVRGPAAPTQDGPTPPANVAQGEGA